MSHLKVYILRVYTNLRQTRFTKTKMIFRNSSDLRNLQ